MIDPIDLRDDRSFDADVPALVLLFNLWTPAETDALLVEAGSPAQVMPRDELLSHLRACGLHGVVREAERLELPPRHVLTVLVSDHSGVRVRAIRLPNPDDEDTFPRAHVALAPLGRFAGQGDTSR